jgi:tetratricopeptide (TPR) repeat protein
MMVRKLALAAVLALTFVGAALGQTGSIAGGVKGEDGKPLQGALIKIERTDIKGNYKVKTNKKGEFFHAGLPLGQYSVTCEVNGQDVDRQNGIRTTLGDPTQVNFDLQKIKVKQQALQKAAETGQLTKEQEKELSPEAKAQIEAQNKQRTAAMAKNKELNDAFNAGMTAKNEKRFDAAVEGFQKASELDPKQHVVWANLAESYVGLAGTKTGADQDAAMAKGLEHYQKALELKPDDGSYHNNYALALARAKKFPEAQAELAKAAQLDPPNAGRYYYNLGALLVNAGQNEAAVEFFKKAIESDPNYADAHYQYGIALISKAQVGADGKITPPAGTKEEFEKYLQIKPDGPFAESAKQMIASISGSIQTEYKNPSAPAPKKPAARKGK